jgi:ribosomal subunit interface protein
MTTNITYHGIESTPAITAYAEEKMQGLTKYFDGIKHMDIEVGMSTHHHQKGDIFKCKVVIETLKEVIRIEKEEEELYKAIDEVKDHARLELSSLKERIQDRQRGESVE